MPIILPITAMIVLCLASTVASMTTGPGTPTTPTASPMGRSRWAETILFQPPSSMPLMQFAIRMAVSYLSKPKFRSSMLARVSYDLDDDTNVYFEALHSQNTIKGHQSYVGPDIFTGGTSALRGRAKSGCHSFQRQLRHLGAALRDRLPFRSWRLAGSRHPV